MAAVAFFWLNIAVDRSAVAAAIRQIKPHATMLALSADISIGIPSSDRLGEFGSAEPAPSGSPSGGNQALYRDPRSANRRPA